MHVSLVKKPCKGVQDLRIRKEEFDELLSPVELRSDTVCLWAATPPYIVIGGSISPKEAGKASKADVYFPLSDSNLFLSFARLGSRGAPSEDSILKWVSRYGLLRGRDRVRYPAAEDRGANIETEERIVQFPAEVSDFRREVRQASQLLRLYADLRFRDHDAMARWFLDPLPVRAPAELTMIERHLSSWRTSFEYEGVEWMLAKGVTTRLREGEVLLGTAAGYFFDALAHTVADAKLSLTRFPAPAQEKLPELPRARRTLRCPDLLSAIYLQFYLFVTNDTPMRHCENPACGMPFPATRKDKRHCNATCRSNARHHRSH